MPAVRVIGLMSGTSADAVDAALVAWPDGSEARPFRLLAWREEPLPAALQRRIHELAAGRVPGGEVLAELATLDGMLGERFAAAAGAVARDAGLGLEAVDAIASHGQTVAHHPERHATLQIGDPSRIAERTGCTTVADFRARDMAAGGEGAPLAPFFHHALLSSPEEDRAVLNLGGIANLTWLPCEGDPEAVVAFDVGPANALLDAAVVGASGGRERMDRDGARAAAGKLQADWLAELLEDAYLRRPPPKSTGREHYGPAEAGAWVERTRREGRTLEDLLATLVAFSAEAVARAVRDFLPRAPARVLLGGGGARNPVLVEALRQRLEGSCVEPMDAFGVPADAAEAMAFSLMGRNALLGIPNQIARCTGARGARVLGELVPGRGNLRWSRPPSPGG